MTQRRTTTQRGLGHHHQQQRARLLRQHYDGAPCPCQPGCGPACLCLGTTGLPMYRDPVLNADRLPLEADHTIARAHGGTQADRLLLATCNRSRGGLLANPAVFRMLRTTREW